MRCQQRPSGRTGYSHAEQERLLIHQLLKGCPHPLAIASNSPSWHVRKVLKCLGLHSLAVQQILTPDSAESGQYPTKQHAKDFFDGNWMTSFDSILFFDDSRSNLDHVNSEWGNVKPIHIGHTRSSLSDALLRNLGLVDLEFEFDAVKYLECKNRVDSQSIHAATWNLVISQLRDRIQRQGSVWITDVGAGRLNMLSMLLNGESSFGLNALVCQPKNDVFVAYTAYESNTKLLSSCQDQLRSLGFRLIESPSGDEFIYSKSNWNVRLVMRDFEDDHRAYGVGASPDLIIGCCFADLMDPQVLASSLLRSFGLLESPRRSTLVYFPITFSGETQFLPPSPFEVQDSSSRAVPSDTYAFQVYSRALCNNFGHNLDTFLLEEVMADYGAELVSKGASNWQIDPVDNSYLTDTMLYFFGRTAGPPLLHQGLDAPAWIRRAKQNRPTIQVSNVDLLFQVGPILADDSVDHVCIDNESDDQELAYLEEIQFVAPEAVTSVRRSIPALAPTEVLSKLPTRRES
jgi:hypothetical protein